MKKKGNKTKILVAEPKVKKQKKYSNKMRIAFIYPRFTGPYGGERLILNLTRGLIEHGDDITIFTRSYPENIKALTNNITIVQKNYLKTKNHQLSSLLDFFLMPLITKDIKKDFDLVVAMGWQSAFGGYWYKKFRNKNTKLIYYALEPPRFLYDLRSEGKKNSFKHLLILPFFNLIRILDKVSVRYINNIISISEWTQNQIKNIYGKDSEIVYPGVETSRFKNKTKEQSRNKLKIPTNQVVYISVSKIHKRKRLKEAVNVFTKHKSKNSMFYILGDGPDKKSLESYITRKKIRNIKILGEQSDDKVTYFMKAADYFIFTAINEPFGIAPLEAKFAGAKIIPGKARYEVIDWGEAVQTNRRYFKKILNA